MDPSFNTILINLILLLLNPLTYWIAFTIILSTFRRVREDRRLFGKKIKAHFSEIKHTFLITLCFSILISIASIFFQLELTKEMIFVLISFVILFSLFNSYSLLSAVYTMGVTYLFLLIMPYVLPNNAVFQSMALINQNHLLAIALFICMFLLAEVFLVFLPKRQSSFPKLLKSKRGKWVGVHEIKRLAVIPFLVYIPTDWLEPLFSYISFVHLDSSGKQLIIFPFMIGYQLQVQSMLPHQIRKLLGKGLIGLSIVLIILTNFAFEQPILTLVVIVAGVIGREIILLMTRMKDKAKPSLFNPPGNGLKVLAILPNSPAMRIDLQIGDTITKVNGIDVHNSQMFYEALQNSGAFFKLYIRDTQNEMRFITSAFYEEDHHELGIVFSKEPYYKK